MKAVHWGMSLLVAGWMSSAVAQDKPHWEYEGEAGPANWSSLSGDFAACAGSQQSPIDLTNAFTADIEDLAVSWPAGPGTVVNNGHSIQVNVPEGSSATLGDHSYDLLQFHFHHHSEHAIDGQTSEMEAHFVHKGDAGLMVVGVMIEEGEENPLLAEIWSVIPAEEGGEAALDAELDLSQLMPESTDMYRYAGSLTTPPCSEIVSWVIMQAPVEASREQIDAFAALYPGNARPLQSSYRRFVLKGN